MSNLFNISEAASIAIHGMVLVAKSENQISVSEIARKTSSSPHHVAKIMQNLAKLNYLRSRRGPNGGFVLNKDPEKVSLLEIYEAIEGKMIIQKCMGINSSCSYDKCIINNITQDLSIQFKNYLGTRMLALFL